MKDKLNQLFFVLFSFYLFGVLTLGKSFSLLRIDLLSSHLFVTEIILFLGAVIVALNLKTIAGLPKALLFPLSAYFIFGSVYFISGVAKNNFFVFRDIVYFGYILFFPAVFVVFRDYKRFRVLALVVFIANLIEIFLGRLFIFNIYPGASFGNLLSNIKPVNYGFNYVISVILMLVAASVVKGRYAKAGLSLLISLNCYMLFMNGGRFLLTGLLAAFVFLLFTLRGRLVKTLLFLIPAIAVSFPLLISLDRQCLKHDRLNVIVAKTKTVANFNKIVSLTGEVFKLDQSGRRAKASVMQRAGEATAGRATQPLAVYAASENSGRFKGPSGEFWASIGNSRETEAYSNIYWRMVIWKQSIEFALPHFILGMGFGVYPVYKVWSYDYIDPVIPKKQYFNSGVTPAHNHLVSIFYKMGLLGLGLFLLINIYLFILGLNFLKRTSEEECRTALTVVLAYFVFWHSIALFFDVIDSPATSIFLWVFAGLIFALPGIPWGKDKL